MSYYIVPQSRIQKCNDNLVVLVWSDTHAAPVTKVTEKSSALLNDQVIVEEI